MGRKKNLDAEPEHRLLAEVLREREIPDGFDFEDYGHLDGVMDMNVWIPEFLSRNQAFMDAYRKTASIAMERVEEHILSIYRQHGVLLPKLDADDYLKDGLPKIKFPRPVRCQRFIENRHGLSKIERQMSDYELLDNWLSVGIHYPGDKKLMDRLLGKRNRKDLGNVLLLAIDISRPLEGISEVFKWVRKLNRRGVKSVIKELDKWKGYLMIYDLKMLGCSWNKISDILSNEYPDTDSYKSSTTVQKAHGACNRLINKEYQKYI